MTKCRSNCKNRCTKRCWDKIQFRRIEFFVVKKGRDDMLNITSNKMLEKKKTWRLLKFFKRFICS